MKINEIYDPEDRKAALNAIMRDMRHQYSRRPQRSPEEIEARRRAGDEIIAKRKRIEDLLVPVAEKLRADQFEEFERQARELVPEEELKLVHLRTIFNVHNPEIKKSFAAFWDNYADSSERTGMGPTGQRNWTGD